MTPENTNEDPNDPEPVDGDTQMKYSLIIAYRAFFLKKCLGVLSV
jgi:hypothetical protein